MSGGGGGSLGLLGWCGRWGGVVLMGGFLEELGFGDLGSGWLIVCSRFLVLSFGLVVKEEVLRGVF